MKQFLKIYLWQVLSLITGFATMFVVTPFLASNQSYFGIYTFVISLNLFLSYADFGFLNAGSKFASEAFAKGDRQMEIDILGFVTFILSLVFAVFSALLLYFHFFPNSILSGLNTTDKISLFKELLLTFILCLPILVGHRILQLIFNIRLQDYKYQRISSVLNLFKIASVFVFFRNGEYHITAYYLLTQILTLVGIILGAILAKQQFEYDFLNFLSRVRLNKEIFRRTKNLAFNSLFVTISWVIYYELDSLVIGKYVGINEVAIFNLCIAIMTLARSLYSIVYNPFAAKFNHYLGKQELKSFESSFYKLLYIGFPLSMIPTTVLIITMQSFIYSWVGDQSYKLAVPIGSVMFASYYFAFVSYPTGIAMVALQRVRSLYVVSAIIPVTYWLGISFTYEKLGLMSFGLFKFIAFSISAVFYAFYCEKFLNFNWFLFLKRCLLPATATLTVILFMHSQLHMYLPYKKGKFEMVQYATMAFTYISIGMLTFYAFSKHFRGIAKEIMRGIF